MRDREKEFVCWVDHAMRDSDEPFPESVATCGDAFDRDLAFGTGGLRGLVGFGPNRMNVYTVGKATQGLSDYLNEKFGPCLIAIARDSRHMGEKFVAEAASVLVANGHAVRVFSEPVPTPALSWAVRDLGCGAGVCVTASHNPAGYSGYKVYSPDGCQITVEAARAIQEAIDGVDPFDGVPHVAPVDVEHSDLMDGVLRRYMDASLDRGFGSYSDEDGRAVGAARPAWQSEPLSVAYTPLNGTGGRCIPPILERMEVRVRTVPEQAEPDGEFLTCPKPNPEEPAALELGARLCEGEGADLLLASDPDADRLGVAALHGGKAVRLTGNEVGMLLLDYVCAMREARGEDLRDAVVATTVVSSSMADAMAEDRGFELRRTLTGFKYIGEQIGLLEAAGEAGRFIFGFEESCGYLSGTHVRDKDALNAAVLVCEAARWHKAQGRDLVEAMEDLYRRYGWHGDRLVSAGYPGADGPELMRSVILGLRENPPAEVAGMKVEGVADYAGGAPMPVVGGRGDTKPQELPSSDVLELHLSGDCKLMIRPSGTEPKIKAYLFAKGSGRAEVDAKLDVLGGAAMRIFGQR